MKWKDNFKEGKELVLATCSKTAQPNANVVISLGFSKDKLLVADCSMVRTIRNLKENPRACVIGGYVRLCGRAKVFSFGEHFNRCVRIVASQDNTLKVNHAIVISVDKAFDLEAVKKIE